MSHDIIRPGDTLRLDEIEEGFEVALATVVHEPVCNTSDAVLLAQTKLNLTRGLPELRECVATDSAPRRTLSLCGSGPSLIGTLPELQGKVMACNAAILALSARGLRPDYAMIWDATPEMSRYVVDLFPQTLWMVASRVHPSVLDKLIDLDQRIMLWHTATTVPELAKVLEGRLQVCGGPHSITRGPFLAGAMGYEDLHIFGADSSFSDAKETHVGGPLRDEHEIGVVCEGRVFQSTLWMQHQAQIWVDFVLPELEARANRPDGMTFTMHGDGLLPWAHKIYKDRTAVACR